MVDFIDLQINKKDIVYDSKVKTTKSSNGIIRIRKKMKEAYVIFPILRKNTDDTVMVAIDEILKRTVEQENDKTYKIDINRKYAGRKCIVIDAEEPFTFEIPTREIIKKDTVKRTYNGQGIIRIKDKYLGNRVYVILPMRYHYEGNLTVVEVDEVFNLGVHPDNDHISGVLFGQDYVDRECIIILQEG